jgi:tetratricopeptide (TPR) repeat protein
MALLHHGKGKLADSHFRAAVAASRDAAPAAEIANSLLQAGCYDKAEGYGRIALDRDPQDGEILGMMAEIMFRLGRNDEARAFLEAGRKNAAGNEFLLETLEFLEEDFA